MERPPGPDVSPGVFELAPRHFIACCLLSPFPAPYPVTVVSLVRPQIEIPQEKVIVMSPS